MDQEAKSWGHGEHCGAELGLGWTLWSWDVVVGIMAQKVGAMVNIMRFGDCGCHHGAELGSGQTPCGWETMVGIVAWGDHDGHHGVGPWWMPWGWETVMGIMGLGLWWTL